MTPYTDVMLKALREIADRWDFRIPAPNEEHWGDGMQDAYGNGSDYAAWESAVIAQDALVAIGDRPAVAAEGVRCYECHSVVDVTLENDSGEDVCADCEPDLFEEDEPEEEATDRSPVP